jgi:hypothetical protein
MNAIGSTKQKTSDDGRIKSLRKHLKPLRKNLRASGADEIVMSYQGCDGIVDFNDFELWSNRRRLTAPELTAFHAELRVLFGELLQLRNPAWETDLGGSGEILWDLSSNRLRHTHDTNVLEYLSTMYEGL